MSNQVRPLDRSPFWVHDAITAVISPALIMGMIYCLVRFLIIVFYRDGFEARLNYLLALYVFAAVLVARIAIESGRSLAMMYSGALGLAAWVVISKFAQFTGPLATLSPLINIGLLILVAYLADRITFDCTLVESDRDSSGEGLLQSLGLVRSAYQGEAKVASSQVKQEQPNTNHATQQKRRRKRKHNPGVSVLYFALLALPLFGLGQLTLPVFDSDVRTRAFNCLFGYLFCSMSLLVATSFLGLRRYLSSRGVDVPAAMTATWLTGGVVGVLLLLVACFALPIPGRQFGLFGLPFEIRSPENLTASRWGWGQEGVPQGSPDSAKIQQSSESGADGSHSGKRQPNTTSSGAQSQAQSKTGSNQGQGNSNSSGASSSSRNQNGQNQSDNDSSRSQANRSARNAPQSSQSNSSDSPSRGSDSSSSLDRPNDSSSNRSSSSQVDRQSKSSDPNSSPAKRPSDSSRGQGEQDRATSPSRADQRDPSSPDRQNRPSDSNDSSSSSGEQQGNEKSESDSSSGQSERSDSSNPSQTPQASNNQDQNRQASGEQQETSNQSPSENRPSESQAESQPDQAGQDAESGDQPEQRSEDSQASEKSETNSSESSDSENQSQPSQAWSSLSQLLGWIPFLIKAITIAALAIFVVYYVLTHRDEVRKMFQDLWNWWLQLFGRKPTEIASVSQPTVAVPVARRLRPFSSFANPLQTNRTIPDSQLAQYTFEAIEAWAAERGVKRVEEQTAEEFVLQVVQIFPKLKSDAVLFIRDYCQLAYARDLRKSIDRTAIGRIWQFLQTT